MCLLGKCLFGLLPIFWLGCLFSSVLSCMSCLYILEINPLSVLSFASIYISFDIFSQFVSCLFILFMISFAVQKLLSLIKSHLFIFLFIFINLEMDLKDIAYLLTICMSSLEKCYSGHFLLFNWWISVFFFCNQVVWVLYIILIWILNRTCHGIMDWFKIEKVVYQGCILSPCLFNLICRVHHAKCWARWSTSWNQDFWENY